MGHDFALTKIKCTYSGKKLSLKKLSCLSVRVPVIKISIKEILKAK